jgi:hypothetical protein
MVLDFSKTFDKKINVIKSFSHAALTRSPSTNSVDTGDYATWVTVNVECHAETKDPPHNTEASRKNELWYQPNTMARHGLWWPRIMSSHLAFVDEVRKRVSQSFP